MRPLLKGRTTTPWRTAILLERRTLEEPNTSFYGIRTSNGRKYIAYQGGFRELYNLNADPYELVNSYDEQELPPALATRLQALRDCAGATCRAVENGNGDNDQDNHNDYKQTVWVLGIPRSTA